MKKKGKLGSGGAGELIGETRLPCCAYTLPRGEHGYKMQITITQRNSCFELRLDGIIILYMYMQFTPPTTMNVTAIFTK